MPFVGFETQCPPPLPQLVFEGGRALSRLLLPLLSKRIVCSVAHTHTHIVVIVYICAAVGYLPWPTKSCCLMLRVRSSSSIRQRQAHTHTHKITRGRPLQLLCIIRTMREMTNFNGLISDAVQPLCCRRSTPSPPPRTKFSLLYIYIYHIQITLCYWIN